MSAYILHFHALKKQNKQDIHTGFGKVVFTKRWKQEND